MPWGRLSDMIDRSKSLMINEAFVFAFGVSDNRELVISLISGEGTQFGQLWNGIDGRGRLLSSIGGDYSNLTKEIKRLKGLPIDRVTLYDTGAFYESFRVTVQGEGITITANTIKEGQDLRERYGDSLLELTAENKLRLAQALVVDVRDWLLNVLL